MGREKEGEGVEKRVNVNGLNVRGIIEARAMASGAAPTPEHLDLMVKNYYAHTNGANVLNETAINSIVELYLTSPHITGPVSDDYTRPSDVTPLKLS